MKKFFIKILLYMMLPFLKLRLWIIRQLLALRAKLQIGSLKVAIADADKNKEKTGRKNMVVFNTVSGTYEPIQKKTLKAVANLSKNTSNKAMTEGRKKMMKKRKARVIDMGRVHQIEKKSLYVTK